MAAICAPPSRKPRATMAEPHTGSAMGREIAEIPTAAERLLARTDAMAAIAAPIEQAKPRIVVFCGRRPCRPLSAACFRGPAWRPRLRRRAFRSDRLSPAPRNARRLVCRHLAVRTQPGPGERHTGGAQARCVDACHHQ